MCSRAPREIRRFVFARGALLDDEARAFVPRAYAAARRFGAVITTATVPTLAMRQWRFEVLATGGRPVGPSSEQASAARAFV
jgi:hypothetical protein